MRQKHLKNIEILILAGCTNISDFSKCSSYSAFTILDLHCPKTTLFKPQMGVKMLIFSNNASETPQKHRNPDISKFVQTFPTFQNAFHTATSQFRSFIARKPLFFSPKWGPKCQFSVIMPQKHLKNIENLILAGLYKHFRLFKMLFMQRLHNLGASLLENHSC